MLIWVKNWDLWNQFLFVYIYGARTWAQLLKKKCESLIVNEVKISEKKKINTFFWIAAFNLTGSQKKKWKDQIMFLSLPLLCWTIILISGFARCNDKVGIKAAEISSFQWSKQSLLFLWDKPSYPEAGSARKIDKSPHSDRLFRRYPDSNVYQIIFRLQRTMERDCWHPVQVAFMSHMKAHRSKDWGI